MSPRDMHVVAQNETKCRAAELREERQHRALAPPELGRVYGIDVPISVEVERHVVVRLAHDAPLRPAEQRRIDAVDLPVAVAVAELSVEPILSSLVAVK